ncbi:MAG: FMN-binding protein [Candidatus Gracilibacteria bacterium]|nr:FMN-binding protein [Candidatus Gracilibacteria bacterium]
MKIKKPLIKVIQIGTLFVFTSLSFLGIISFSNPEISNFWTIKKINITAKYISYADDDDDDNYNRNYGNYDNNDDNDDDNDNNDDDDDNDVKPTTTTRNSIITNTNTNNTTQTGITTLANTNSGTTNTSNCTTVTKTIYDTVTSASGTTSQVPRQVVSEVCGTTTSINNITTNSGTINKNTIPVNINIYSDGTYIGNGKYLYTGGSINYSVEIIISSGKITSAKFISFTQSGNGLYTREQADIKLSNIVATQNTVIDTVSGASGTSKAIQDAIDDALLKAKKITNSPTTIQNIQTNTSSTNTGVIDNSKVKNIISNVLSTGLTEAEKNKVNLLIDNKLNIYNTNEKKINKLNPILSKLKRLIVNLKISKTKLDNESDILRIEDKINVYIDVKEIISTKIQNLELQNDLTNNSLLNINDVELYTAPNGKVYTIMFENGKVVIKKADGSYAKETFITFDEAKKYLDINAPKKVVVKPVVTKKTTTTKKIISNTPAKTVTTTPTKTTTTVVTPTPAVDTTTKAS